MKPATTRYKPFSFQWCAVPCLTCFCHHLCLQPGAARPEIVAEVASSLADMLYAGDKLIDAKEALQVSRQQSQSLVIVFVVSGCCISTLPVCSLVVLQLFSHLNSST